MRGEMEGREVQDAAEGAVAGGDPRDASGEAGGDAGREREACGGVTENARCVERSRWERGAEEACRDGGEE